MHNKFISIILLTIGGNTIIAKPQLLDHHVCKAEITFCSLHFPYDTQLNGTSFLLCYLLFVLRLPPGNESLELLHINLHIFQVPAHPSSTECIWPSNNSSISHFTIFTYSMMTHWFISIYKRLILNFYQACWFKFLYKVTWICL